MSSKHEKLRNAQLSTFWLSAMCLASGQPALAQLADGEGPSAPLGVEEIVVTAQKRLERLQDVPLAVSALSAEQLGNRQINDTNGLAKAIPSLNFQQGNNATNTTFRIRGIGTSLFGQGVEPSVSLVVDGVVAARQAQSFADFADLERIEVLRGPQGTLFGKNATAGVINVITARPAREFEGSVEATYAELDEYRIKGTLSGPISDSIRARLTGYYNNVGGQFDNLATRGDYGGNEGQGARGKIEWDATDRLNFLLSADYRESNVECCRGLLVATANPSLAQLYSPVRAVAENRQTIENAPSYYITNQKTYSLQAEYALGSATITSITAFQQFHTYNNVDVDSVNTPIPTFTGGGANPAQYDDQGGNVDLNNFTQEVRIASNGESRLTYVAGLYYSNLELDRDFRRRRALCAMGTLGEPCTPSAWQSAQHVANADNESVSVFGQAELDIVGGLTAILGLRGQREEVSVYGKRTAPIEPGDQIFPGHNPVEGRRSAKDSVITGKAGLRYEFSRDAQTYATYTRGYKGLGFDTEITADFANQLATEPEDVDAYEIGFKTQAADGKLSFSMAAFLADYTNLQVQANRSDVNTGTVLFVQTNAGSSRTKGIEFEGSWRATEGLSLNAAVTYIEATVSINGLNCPLQEQAAAPVLTGDFPFNSCYRSLLTNSAGVPVTSGPIQDVRDGDLPAAPRWRASLSPRFSQQIPGTRLTGFVQIDATYQSSQQFAVEQDPLLQQPSYTLVDASIGVRDEEGRYTFALFVKNLTDRNYYTNLAHGGLLASTASPNDLYGNFNKDADRYFGATLGVRF